MTRNTRARRSCIGMLATSLCIATLTHAQPTTQSIAPTLDDINESWSLRDSNLERLRFDPAGRAGVEVTIPIDGSVLKLDLEPRSIRTDGYRILEDRGTGRLIEHQPGPINTYAGTVRGMPGSSVTASYMDERLTLGITLADGERWWAEPIASRFPQADDDLYTVYAQDNIISPPGFCGTNAFEHRVIGEYEWNKIRATGGGTTRGSVCTSELACDADYEYFSAYGSVSAVEDRINSVINAINTQYETQCGLTHSITTIIVRTTTSDPYSGSLDNRLEQVRNHWNIEQGSIQRDSVQLFSGIGGNGSTIGIAWLSAICTSYGYSAVQSDCCGSFGCATDLTAHELGHNWGADHCDCTSNTMNPYITCSNSFTANSISDITSYRDSISGCLDGECGDGGGGGDVENDECADAIFVSLGTTAFSNSGGTTSSDAYDESQCGGTYLGDMNADVWFAWVATSSGTLTVSTCDLVDFDTDLVVYQGSCNDKTQIGCNGDFDGCGGYSSQTAVTVQNGALYLFRVGGWDSGASGSGSLLLSLDPDEDPTGGCCTGTNCSVTTQDDCGGTYLGDGSDCSGDPCAPDPTGGCCTGTNCSVTTQDDCGGTYLGDGSDCSGDPCAPDPTGGCCTGTNCSITSQNDCGGTYLGDGSDCSGDPCASDPTGGCCTGTNCSVTTQDNCNGTYLGDGSDCSGTPCGGGGDEPLLGIGWSIVGSNLVDDDSATWTVDVYAILSPGCRVDAIAGDVSQQKLISTTSSFYQNQYGGPTSQSINPALFGAFPDLRFDSFVTIGLTDQTDNALSNIGIDWSSFESGGAVNTTDGSWYVTPDDAQGDGITFSDQNCEAANGVLIARLTTRDLSSTVYVEALLQGKDAAGQTWQSPGSASIQYDDCGSQCTGDYDGNGTTDVSDLLLVIANWESPYDVTDLLAVIADWGCGEG